MASPQLENGHTRIANEILEAVARSKLNGTQIRMLLIVWRSTYGWGKKEFELSLSYLATALDIKKRQVQRELNNLVEMGILEVVKEAGFSSPRVIAFNKNYEIWRQVINKTPGDKLDTSTGDKLAVSPGDKLDYQKRNIKRNIKEIYNTALSDNLNAIEKEFGRPLSPIELEQVQKWGKSYPREIITEALKIMILRGVYNLIYMDRILQGWEKQNLKTIQQVREHEEKRQKGKTEKPVSERGKMLEGLYEL